MSLAFYCSSNSFADIANLFHCARLTGPHHIRFSLPGYFILLLVSASCLQNFCVLLRDLKGTLLHYQERASALMTYCLSRETSSAVSAFSRSRGEESEFSVQKDTSASSYLSGDLSFRRPKAKLHWLFGL